MIDFIGIELIIFHDLPVQSINLNSKDKFELELIVTPYNEETASYDLIKLSFADFQHLNIGKIEMIKDSELEITSFDYYMKDELFHGKMILSMGYAKPVFNIDFACKRVYVN
ncbi:MAG: hypothetical protein DWQ02_05765 [Bacteroidetes bacterium]|nr:MAG: hypothetical protein DWQ02_05765 [Bacteroidota bacterium]